MKKILITGSSGLVGSACYELFTAEGWDVLGIDNDMRSKLFGTEKRNPQNPVDIRDEAFINEIFERFKPDAVIHAAAQPSHDWAKNDPLVDFDINARATVILLEATRKFAPEAVFVHVSTDKVYGENMVRKLETRKTRMHSAKPFAENLGLDFAGHRSLFGCSKTAADIYAQEYADWGLTVGIFRPGCITGKNHAGAEYHGFLAYLAHCVREGKKYTIFGDGLTVRDQIHAHDLARAFKAFIDKPKKGAVYNIGGGPDRSVSVMEAIKLFEDKIGKKLTYDYGPERAGDRRWDVHDVSKFRNDYPEWDYKYSLEDIIEDLCKN